MEHHDEYQSEAAALTAIAGNLGCSPDSLRVWMRQAQRDGSERPGLTSAEIARALEQIRDIIAMETPLQRCAIDVITHLVKAKRTDLAREVSDLMRQSGRLDGQDVIFPDTDIWDQLREAVARKVVARDEFRSWLHFMAAIFLAEDRLSALHLEELLAKRLAP